MPWSQVYRQNGSDVVDSILTLNVTNAGAAKAGTVVVYVR